MPDKLLSATVSAIQQTGLANCTELKTCGIVREFRPSPAPAAHFHIDNEITISFYGKSTTLWFLPSLSLSPTSEGPEDMILASDSRLLPPRPGRGHGAFQPHCFPVCVPSAHRLLEAYTRLIARTHGRRHEYFFMSMLTYIWEYVDDDELLDWASLEKRCRVFYEGFKSFERPLATLLEELEANFPEEAVDEPQVLLPQPMLEVEDVAVKLLADQGPENGGEGARDVGVLESPDKAYL